MRITLQRVSKAICRVDNEIVGKIENGLLIFVGFAASDTFEILHYETKSSVGTPSSIISLNPFVPTV